MKILLQYSYFKKFDKKKWKSMEKLPVLSYERTNSDIILNSSQHILIFAKIEMRLIFRIDCIYSCMNIEKKNISHTFSLSKQ